MFKEHNSIETSDFTLFMYYLFLFSIYQENLIYQFSCVHLPCRRRKVIS